MPMMVSESSIPLPSKCFVLIPVPFRLPSTFTMVKAPEEKRSCRRHVVRQHQWMLSRPLAGVVQEQLRNRPQESTSLCQSNRPAPLQQNSLSPRGSAGTELDRKQTEPSIVTAPEVLLRDSKHPIQSASTIKTMMYFGPSCHRVRMHRKESGQVSG